VGRRFLTFFSLLITILGNENTPGATVEWLCMDEVAWKLDTYTLKPLTPPHHTVDADEIDYQDYSLVVTGDVFRWLINYAPLETLQRVSALLPPASSHC
jgi:cation-transporting ATPase 13A3/4/5